jgi:hypothetical protein
MANYNIQVNYCPISQTYAKYNKSYKTKETKNR